MNNKSEVKKDILAILFAFSYFFISIIDFKIASFFILSGGFLFFYKKIIANDLVRIEVSLIKIGLLLVLISNLISFLFSIEKLNGLEQLINHISIFFFFFLFKALSKTTRIHFFFSYCFSVANFLTLITLVFFVFFHCKSLNQVGFDNLYDFKNLYNPIGLPNNVWGSYLFLALVINFHIFLSKNNSKRLTCLSTININLLLFHLLFSFSRSVYIVSSMYIVCVVFLLFIKEKKATKLKKFLLLLISSIITLIVSIFVFKKEIQTTISFNKTVSQRRSNLGRIDKWKKIQFIIEDSYLFGVGPKNYPLKQNERIKLDIEGAYSQRVDNLVLHILVENGILGLALYFCLFFLLICLFLRKSNNISQTTKNNRRQLTILLFGIILFLLKELTFVSIYDSDKVLLLFFFLIVLLSEKDKIICVIKLTKKTKDIFFCILFISFITIFISYVKNLKLRSEHNQLVNNKIDGYTEEVFKQEEKSFMYLKHKAFFGLENNLNISFGIKDDENFLKVSCKDEKKCHQSRRLLEKSNELYPFDSEIYHNLAWVNFLNKKHTEEASQIIDKSIELNPIDCSNLISKVVFSIQKDQLLINKDLISQIINIKPSFIHSKLYSLLLEKKYISLKPKEKIISNLRDLENKSTLTKARLGCLLIEDNPKEARKILLNVTEELPNLNRPWAYLGILDFNNKDYSNSLDKMKKSKFLDSSDYLPYFFLGEIHHKLGDKDLSKENFDLSYKYFKMSKSVSLKRNMSLYDGIKPPLNTLISQKLILSSEFEVDFLSAFQRLRNESKENFDLEYYQNIIDNIILNDF